MCGCASQNSSARAAISSRLRVLLFILAHLLSFFCAVRQPEHRSSGAKIENCSSESPASPRRQPPVDISCHICKCGYEKQKRFVGNVDGYRSEQFGTERKL